MKEDTDLSKDGTAKTVSTKIPLFYYVLDAAILLGNVCGSGPFTFLIVSLIAFAISYVVQWQVLSKVVSDFAVISLTILLRDFVVYWYNWIHYWQPLAQMSEHVHIQGWW